MFCKTILLINFLIYIEAILMDDEIKINPKHPTLKERLGLYSLYSKIPLENELKKYAEFELLFLYTNFSTDGLIMEFDSLGWMKGKQTINHKLPYFMANPAFRTSHISKEWCESKEFFHLGFRIHQITREFGLPLSVKCATCHPIIEGLNNINYLYPERDFDQQLTKLAISSRTISLDPNHCDSKDCEQNPRVAEFQEYFVSNGLHFGKLTRWSGEHVTTEQDREIMGPPNGELAIHSRLTDGFTTMCGLELNGKVVSSNIFVNSDVVGAANSDEVFTYQHYESLKLLKNSIEDSTLNLELFAFWSDWGCCSACCCPAAICGHEFQTSSDCENVFSSRTRTGHLSIRLLKASGSTIQDQHFLELYKLLSIPPYSRTGIPLFSSLLSHKPILKIAVKNITESLVPKFLSANKNDGYEFKSGMFVSSESCKSNLQKTDCLEWAKCHNISLSEATVESSEIMLDSCQQVHFVDVLVGTENMKVIVGEHQNLRIRVDSEVYDMNKIKPVWRVNLRKPRKYDKSRPCLVQGIVQRADEILILNFAQWDLKVDLILGKEKVRITFVSDRRSESDRVVQYTIFYWAIAIIVFFLLLISAVIFMHREKTKRMERAIRSK